MKIETVIVPLEDVLKYYRKDFKSNDGEIKTHGQTLVDQVAGKVVFTLYVENNQKVISRPKIKI